MPHPLCGQVQEYHPFPEVLISYPDNHTRQTTETPRIVDKAIFYKNWAKAGVKNIKDLMNDEYEVTTYRKFKGKYCFPVSFLEFYGVASATRSAMKSLKMKSQSESDFSTKTDCSN